MVIINNPTIQKQEGTNDCGLFALANTTSLCYNINPTSFTFEQKDMKDKLYQK